MPLPLAVQLYTFRDPARFGGAGMGLDPATLEAIAAAGLRGVETVDVPGGDPVAARRVLADTGLEVVSAHTWTALDDLDAVERAAADLAGLGSPHMIVSGSGFDSVDAVERFGDRLAAAGEVATRHGLRFGYHNHSQEMGSLDGEPILDRLARQMRADVDLQLDIFWVRVGGADPAAVIDRLGSRIVSLHIKDGIDLPATAGGDMPFVNVAVGDGIVDPGPAIAAAQTHTGIAWLIVEFDHVDGSPIDAVRRSHDYLVGHGLGRGRG